MPAEEPPIPRLAPPTSLSADDQAFLGRMLRSPLSDIQRLCQINDRLFAGLEAERERRDTELRAAFLSLCDTIDAEWTTQRSFTYRVGLRALVEFAFPKVAGVARPCDPLSTHEANNCTKAQALIAHIQSLAGNDHVQRDWITALMQDRWGSFWQQMAAFHEMLCTSEKE